MVFSLLACCRVVENSFQQEEKQYRENPASRQGDNPGKHNVSDHAQIERTNTAGDTDTDDLSDDERVVKSKKGLMKMSNVDEKSLSFEYKSKVSKDMFSKKHKDIQRM